MIGLVISDGMKTAVLFGLFDSIEIREWYLDIKFSLFPGSYFDSPSFCFFPSEVRTYFSLGKR